MKRLGLLFTLSGALVLLLAGSAQAFLYWASSQDAELGRANNDASGVDKVFIKTGNLPFAVAVNSSHIYWANQNGNSIGRAKLDGSGVNNSFITGISQPTGVALTGSYIFWSSLNNKIGRANLDGSSPNTSLIGTQTPCGVAVDSGHVYWAQDTGPPALIGRASFTGANVSQNWVTIPGVAFPCGVAVNSANIFWADTGFFGGGTNIGRANTSTGMGADASTIGDASTPCGVALDSSHLYWANAGTNRIGRAKTDSTAVDESFLRTGGNQICGVAVDSNQPPQTTIKSAKVRKRQATFKFASSQAGSTYRCKLDRAAYRSCRSPKTYRHLKTGRHTFKVQAKSSLNALDPTPAKRKFRIRR